MLERAQRRERSPSCFLIWGIPGGSPEPPPWVSVPTMIHGRGVPGDLSLCSLPASMGHPQKEKMAPSCCRQGYCPACLEGEPQSWAPPAPARAPTVCLLTFPMWPSQEEHWQGMWLCCVCKLLFFPRVSPRPRALRRFSCSDEIAGFWRTLRSRSTAVSSLWSGQVSSRHVSLGSWLCYSGRVGKLLHTPVFPLASW